MAPAVTVPVMLPPVCVPTENGDRGEVPDRLTTWNGTSGVLKTISVAAVVPVDAGMNATVKVQEAPALRKGPQEEVSGKMGWEVTAKSKVTSLRVALPVFVSVIV